MEVQRLRTEIKALTKDNARLKKENDFLEEASAFFAASRQKYARKSE
jgi:transposase